MTVSPIDAFNRFGMNTVSSSVLTTTRWIDESANIASGLGSGVFICMLVLRLDEFQLTSNSNDNALGVLIIMSWAYYWHDY